MSAPAAEANWQVATALTRPGVPHSDRMVLVHTGGVPNAASMLLIGPLIALGVVAALAAVLRWTFSSDISPASAAALFPPTEPSDGGPHAAPTEASGARPAAAGPTGNNPAGNGPAGNGPVGNGPAVTDPTLTDLPVTDPGAPDRGSSDRSLSDRSSSDRGAPDRGVTGPDPAGSSRIDAGTSSAADYGLLAVAGEVDSPEAARRLRDRLSSAGIRSTTALAAPGRIRVLVFATELPTARRVVGGSTL
jgi:hypothetical protein